MLQEKMNEKMSDMIYGKVFETKKRSLRGIDVVELDEVEDFLDILARKAKSYETYMSELINDNETLKKKLEELEKSNEDKQNFIEGTLKNVKSPSKFEKEFKTEDDDSRKTRSLDGVIQSIIEVAEKKSEEYKKEAKIESQRIIIEAKKEADSIKREAEEIKREVERKAFDLYNENEKEAKRILEAAKNRKEFAEKEAEKIIEEAKFEAKKIERNKLEIYEKLMNVYNFIEKEVLDENESKKQNQ